MGGGEGQRGTGDFIFHQALIGAKNQASPVVMGISSDE